MQNFSRQMASAISAGVIAQPQTTAAISFVDAREGPVRYAGLTDDQAQADDDRFGLARWTLSADGRLTAQ